MVSKSHSDYFTYPSGDTYRVHAAFQDGCLLKLYYLRMFLNIHASLEIFLKQRLVWMCRNWNPCPSWGEPLSFMGGTIKWCSHFGKEFDNSSKCQAQSYRVTSNSTARFMLMRIENGVYIKTCTQMFLSAL
ncbi:hypothetical protein H1C71_014964 [Ictidomys tridecemlineatus]|nr:hypothetical protein H1C71_014964 [Ictidomys tridecemlineatus]